MQSIQLILLFLSEYLVWKLQVLAAACHKMQRNVISFQGFVSCNEGRSRPKTSHTQIFLKL